MIKRWRHALANYRDEFILATGGYQSYIAVASAEVYSIDGDRWSPIPAMNVRRSFHGSCAVANYVYVACGQNDEISDGPVKYLQSIERIDMKAI